MTIFDQDCKTNSLLMQNQQTDLTSDEFETPQLRNKRIREKFHESVSPPSKRPKTRTDYLIKRIDYPQIMTRDDAYQLGLRHTSTKVQKIINTLSKKEQEELGITKKDLETSELTNTEKMLTDEECEHIETIGKTYSQTLSSQLLELTAICKEVQDKHPEESEKVLAFANNLIQTLPKTSEGQNSTTTDVIPEEFLTFARDYFDKIANAMGIIIPEAAIQQYAAKHYETSQLSDDEIDHAESSYEDNTEQEAEISRILSNLLFLADNNICLAASCLEATDFKLCSEALINTSHDQMERAKVRINQYENLLINSSVHNTGQALNHFTSIELAKHLLLSNGSFNFAFIDDAIDALIPETLENTEAIKTSYYLLGNLAATPIGAMKIYNAKAPGDKNLPSNELVRATLRIDPQTPISSRDVQVTILSGLIENVRQAKVGSCFATAWLINLLHKHIDMIIEDYIDCIQESKLTRRISHETKSIPFQLRTSREGLDLTLTIDKSGRLVKKERYDKSSDEMTKEPQPNGKAFIWDVPGISAACQSLGYTNAKDIVTRAIRKLRSTTFTPKQLIATIAEITIEETSLTVHFKQNAKKYSLEKLTNIAQYAFGVQSRHALHSAWEQMAAASVIYFCSQFAMSLWVYDSIKESLNPLPPAQTDRQTFRRYKNKLMETILLPMISRMRYRYNHYIEEDKRFFKGNKGVYDVGFYGYELCDTGLPKDFEYSNAVAKALKAGSSYLVYKEFKEYPSEQDWIKIGKEQFQSFVQDVIRETVRHLQAKEKGPNRKEAAAMWSKVGKQFCKQVNSHTFLAKATMNMFGPYGRNAQRKEFKINEFTCQSTPWLLRWGGSPDEVIKSLYGYKENLVGTHKYTGSARSVLAWRINYCRRQPEFIKKQFSDPFYTTVVVNPPHAYIFRPGQERFQEAINSELPAPVWIDNQIMKPGKAIANKNLDRRTRNALIKFVANNQWVRPCDQKQDLQRQELTNHSKKKFDEIISSTPNLLKGTVREFSRKIYHAVIKARASEPLIGRRNHFWEQKFSTVLQNKILSITEWDQRITKDIASKIVNFARNRRDVIELSPSGRQKFTRLMSSIPSGLSIKEFRETLIKQATNIHKEEKGIPKPEKKWVEKITERVDNKIFELLPEKERNTLIESGLISDDPNWCDGVHSLLFIWMVNPGTGELELCRYNKDLQNVEFMHQDVWFPKKKGYYWHLPKNYITFRGEPAFNVKKYTGI